MKTLLNREMTVMGGVWRSVSQRHQGLPHVPQVFPQTAFCHRPGNFHLGHLHKRSATDQGGGCRFTAMGFLQQSETRGETEKTIGVMAVQPVGTLTPIETLWRVAKQQPTKLNLLEVLFLYGVLYALKPAQLSDLCAANTGFTTKY